MFKIIKIELFDKFHCLMDNCPDNCCDEDWLISVDDETYESYQKIGIANLNAFVSLEKPHVIIKNDGKCPFITEKGLCLIHKELGEAFLGNTCRSYPRFVSFYEGNESDLYIENIGLSCPAAADWLVSLDHICLLDEKVLYEQENEVGRFALIMEGEKNMKMLIQPLQTMDSFEQGMQVCYKRAGGEYVSSKLDFLGENDLLLRNICICYLFENLMLESKKENMNYVGVLDKVCSIVKDLDKAIGEEIIDCQIMTKEVISTCLYKIMRKADH